MSLRRPPGRQRGVTLIVALLLLLVVTLATVTGMQAGTTNMRVVGNMVARQEATVAAQSVIDRTISSAQFTQDPLAVAAAEYPVDIDGDGTADFSPRLTPAPQCIDARALKVTELNPEVAEDMACMLSGSLANSGIDSPGMSATTGDSLCANTEWNIRATVEDARTGTSVALNQGVAIRTTISDADSFCD